jgi:hypothetical protein
MIRTIAAGCVAILGVGLVLAPTATSARSGGFAAGGALSFHGAFRPTFVRPAFAPPQAVVGNVAAARRPAFFGARLRHRRDFRFPVTVWGDTGYAAGYDQDALTYPAANDPAADGPPVQGRVVYVPPPPGCRSDSQMVPSETGGQRKITIVRCWR